MLALATTHEGDLPLFLQPLNGNASDKVSVLAVVQAIQELLRATDEAPRVSVANTDISSDANMQDVNHARLPWIGRVPETSTQAKAALSACSEIWQTIDDGTRHVDRRSMSLPQGQARGVIVRTTASEQRAQASVQRQVQRAQAEWEKTCWHLGHPPVCLGNRCACRSGAREKGEARLASICARAWWPMRTMKTEDGPARMPVRSKSCGHSWPA
jgi:hypothetical protein